MIIKIIRKNKIVEMELVFLHATLAVAIPRSIGQLILAVISDLYLFCNQTKWKTSLTPSKTHRLRLMYGSISD